MAKRLVVALVALVVTVLVAGGIWLATSAGETRVDGTCAGASYTLTLDPQEQDRVEVEFELQAGTAGEEWQVSLRRDAETLIEGARVTDEDAEIELEAYAVDDGALFGVEFAPADGSETCSAEARNG